MSSDTNVSLPCTQTHTIKFRWATYVIMPKTKYFRNLNFVVSPIKVVGLQENNSDEIKWFRDNTSSLHYSSLDIMSYEQAVKKCTEITEEIKAAELPGNFIYLFKEKSVAEMFFKSYIIPSIIKIVAKNRNEELNNYKNMFNRLLKWN